MAKYSYLAGVCQYLWYNYFTDIFCGQSLGRCRGDHKPPPAMPGIPFSWRLVAVKIKHLKEQQRHEIGGIILISTGILGLVSLLTPGVGLVSRLVERLLRGAAGEGRYLFPLLLILGGLRLMLGRGRVRAGQRFYGGALLFVVALILLHMLIPPEYALQAGLAGEGGGLVGGVCYFLILRSFGPAGTAIVLVTMAVVGLLMGGNVSLRQAMVRCGETGKNFYQRLGTFVNSYFFTEVEEAAVEAPSRPVIIDHSGAGNTLPEKTPPVEVSSEEKKNPPGDSDSARVLRIVPAGAAREASPAGDPDGSYQLPPLYLLAKPAGARGNKNNRDIAENVRVLEETLHSFGVKARVTQVSRGPAITRYEIQPSPGIKVSRIVGLADDIALSMAAPDVRIEAPIPGKAAVGIEVPNREIAMVFLRELLETVEFQQAASRLTVALGKDIAGNPVLADLAQMPHLLIAGATGSGKSVCLNTIIASILFKARPEEVKFLIIDPKMVELATYNGIPHLVSPVVTDPKKAATSLLWAVKEMEHRYSLFASAGVRDITRYNALFRNRVPSPAEEGPLPLIVLIIDELADLMMIAPADVEDAVCRLAQMARAAGIHLVVATQRPSVDVITGLIKANIPSRISFAVSSQIDSRTILDMAGAEKLLGKGDMLFFPVGAPKPLRVQGAFLSDREVENLVSFLKSQAKPRYDERFLVEEVRGEIHQEPEDELLPRAVEIFIKTGHASISLLQRRLHVGYARAARLIDIMERKGIVGGYEGSKPRPVLISLEQYEQTFKKKVT
ncbi:MAG: DNA translocase FtsK [Thermoanaerobacteraceae bacterium]|nr:DNA translocase FtsK [Thermoanaerobacteraceae bacterium]